VRRFGSVDVGYRRRFENRYRRDPSTDAATPAPLFIPGSLPGTSDHGAYHPVQDHAIDCGVSVAHVDGGAGHCGDGGGN